MGNKYEAIGVRIRSLRLQRNLSQENIAEKAKLSSSYISRIENGLANLRLESLFNVAAALDVDPCDLLDYRHELSRSELETSLISLFSQVSTEEMKLLYRIALFITR